MKFALLGVLTGWILLEPFFPSVAALAASSTPATLKAQQEATAKGYLFITSHDEILAKAKAEGKMRALSSLAPPTFKAMAAAFKKKYPFLDVHVQELDGTDAAQRFLLELKSGTATNWDVAHFTADYFNDFVPYALKVDILGMAARKVLTIEDKMIDPNNRNIVALAADAGVVPYNKTLIASEKVPDKWEDSSNPSTKEESLSWTSGPRLRAISFPRWGWSGCSTTARSWRRSSRFGCGAERGF